MAEALQSWIENGAVNSENFYIDEDARAPPPGSVNVAVGGAFTFQIETQPPFSVCVPLAGQSQVLPRFVASVNERSVADVGARLTLARDAYLALCDDLDAELAAADGDDGDDYAGGAHEVDAIDELNREARESVDEERRQRQRALEEEMTRIKTSYDVTTLPKPCIDRILADYQQVKASRHFGWSAEPAGRNLSLWNIQMFDFEKGTPLAKDMEKLSKQNGQKTVDLTMQFPREYPFAPPFIRVVRPRFQLHTGRVTIGGSICTQLLTDDGWKPVYDVESIIETIRQQITDPESGARIDLGNTADYNEAEAREAFRRVAEYHRQHGW